jgi:hypothetical protein
MPREGKRLTLERFPPKLVDFGDKEALQKGGGVIFAFGMVQRQARAI